MQNHIDESLQDRLADHFEFCNLNDYFYHQRKTGVLEMIKVAIAP